MSFQFTESQKQAIESRGSSVLVSAAAGSGKTRVLTERLIRRVADAEAPVDIDRFLVITYTRSAAAELRTRIMSELGKLAAERPEDRRLRRQQTLCCRASIGTIHSFCTEVIRENCHLLGISPAFQVMEEERAEAMKQSVLTRLLEHRYERIDSDADFRLLADTVGEGRDDARLQSAVLSLYEKLRSHPYPADWAESQKQAMSPDGVSDAGETVWGRELIGFARAEAEYWAVAMEEALQEICDADEKILKAYGPSFSETAAALRDFARALPGGWDKAREALPIPFPRLGALRGYDNGELQERVKAVRERCKKAAGDFAALFDEDSETLLRDLRDTAPAMCALLDLALDFDRAFSAEKTRRGFLDYSDLEHLAARVLVDKSTGAPTAAAAKYAGRFAEVMVDEYQDVNAVQEMIFGAVSRQGQNLFLVGDVKQSIYRFRLADPGLFLAKYRSYAPAETAEDGAPRRILLQQNFRSRRPVLEAANQVFSNIMSTELGELDYDDDAALRFGAAGYDPTGDCVPELVILDPENADSEDAPEGSELEARFVAQRILEMVHSGVTVAGEDGPRKCTWGDFVLLMRAPGSKGSVFHRVLAEAGIPVQSQQGGGFFTSLEVSVAVNLLSLIDNPHSDVPLISVLRSPVFGFSADELSAIRTADRQSDFYGAVCAAAQGGDERCRDFLARLSGWRQLAPDLELGALVWKLCSDTELFAVCSAMSGGEERRQNLMRLFEYARAFSESGYRGVYRFVNYLRRLAEKGTEPERAGDGNAVRIMSIHKSKGLEFPFVFLCDQGHRFNRRDSAERVLMHSELGLGPKYTDLRRGIEYPTLSRTAIAHRMLTEMLSEEMRVLYVGMTRAKERLVMTCVMKNAEAALEKLRPCISAPLAPALLRTAASPAQWLVMAAMADGGEHIRMDIAHSASLPAADGAAEDTAPAAESEEAYRRIAEKLDFVYPFAGTESLPAKLTATELKGRRTEDGDSDAAALPEAKPAPDFAFRRPQPGRAHTLSAAERGTAAHSFLQYADFRKTASEAALRAEAERIAAAGHLSPEEADCIDFSALLRLFRSPLGQAMVSAETLYREFRFTLLTPAADYFDAPEEDRLLLQGIVDCCFAENGGLTVVDYKTDRVSAEGAAERAEFYRGQLETYARALQRIFGLPVKKCVLWFLQPGTGVEISCDFG